MDRLSRFGCLLLSLWVFANPVITRAEISASTLSGSDELFLPKYRYLSPSFGFGLLKTPLLRNLKSYGRNLENLDPVIKMIEILFPRDLIPDQVPSHAVSHFDPKTAGLLLSYLLEETQIEDEEDRQDALIDLLVLDLTDRFKAKRKHLFPVVSVLMEAFRAAEKIPPFQNLPAQVLVAFAILKSESKADFRRFLAELPEKWFKEGTNWRETSKRDGKAFLDSLSKNERSSKRTVKKILSSFDEFISVAYLDRQYGKMVPPFLPYGVTIHSSLEGSPFRSYADCVETSIRNFLVAVFFDPDSGTVNAEEIKKAEGKESRVTLYFRKYSTMDALSTQAARDDWSEIVSELEGGIEYRKPTTQPKCEISSGISNTLKVLSALFPDLTLSRSARSDQLDDLVRFFSRDSRKLAWSAPLGDFGIDQNDYGVTLEFRIEDLPAFSWTFSRTHSEVQPLLATQSSFLEIFRSVWIDSYANSQWDTQIEQFFQTSAWLIRPKDLNSLHEHLKSKPSLIASERILLGFDLSGIFDRIDALSWAEAAGLPKDLVQALYKELPLDDIRTSARLLKALVSQKLQSSELTQEVLSLVKEDIPSSLYVCVEENWIEVVEFLIEQKVDVKKTDDLGDTPLEMAALNGRYEISRALIESGAEFIRVKDSEDLDNFSDPLIHKAITGGSLSLVTYLIDQKKETLAYQTLIDEDSLQAAVRSRSMDMLRFVSKNRKELDYNHKNFSGESSILIAAQMNFEEAVEFLVKHGAKVNSSGGALGNTPLHFAAAHGNLGLVKFLIKKGSNRLSLNFQGDTAYDIAKRKGFDSLLSWLRPKKE